MTLLLSDITWPSVGLCLSSNGGIHQAAFCAGVLSRLLKAGVSLDFMSTVSSGSVVGAAYMDWKMREGGADNAEWHQRFFRHLITNMPLCDFWPSKTRKQVMGSMLIRAADIIVHLLLSLLLISSMVFVVQQPRMFLMDYLDGAWSTIRQSWLVTTPFGEDNTEPIIVTLWAHLLGLFVLLLRSKVSSTSNLSIVRHLSYTLLTILPLLFFMASAVSISLHASISQSKT